MATDAMPTADKSRYKLRWYQYSLRSLLVLMLLVSASANWVAVRRHEVKEQEEAVNAFAKLGLPVAHTNQPDEEFEEDSQTYDVVAWEGEFGPVWVQKVLGEHFFMNVTYLCWHEHPYYPPVNATNADFENLKRLKYLKRLILDQPTISDAGIKNLNGLHRLEELTIWSHTITDSGLESIKGLGRLRALGLYVDELTDAGLADIKALNRLQCLDLSGTKVTDAGLENFKAMTQLRELRFHHTRVTDAGVKRLQQALPNCKIVN